MQDRLRDKLVEMYGEEAGEMYDNINMGMSIGGFVESAIFMDMIEDAGKALGKLPENLEELLKQLKKMLEN